MGSCANLIKPSPQSHPLQNLPTYPRVCTVKIKSKTEPSNPYPYNFILTDPIHLQTESLFISSLEVAATQCVLPGIDPRGAYFRKCQDSCMVLHTNETLFLVLFDGHGSEGSKVINFCNLYVERYFTSCWKDPLVISTKPNPDIFLTELSESCNAELLKSEHKIDSSYSGTTAIFILIHNEILYSASVGDSRAILCSTVESNPLVPYVPKIENEVICQLKASRAQSLNEQLFYLQLTKDQKPDDMEEYQRIIDCGGRVKKLLDGESNKIGPYRVWEMDNDAPGLTMTRSIGDSEAKAIGVIASPYMTTHQIDRKHDLFIVIASDGIWHCMDNEDVINFVQYYRPITSKEIIKHKDSDVNVSNSCIAQLLCEEARARWLSIVEEDDVMIDDISCIVVEFIAQESKKHTKSLINVKRHVNIDKKGSITMHNGAHVPVKRKKLVKSPTICQTNIRDPHRGSNIFSEF